MQTIQIFLSTPAVNLCFYRTTLLSDQRISAHGLHQDLHKTHHKKTLRNVKTFRKSGNVIGLKPHGRMCVDPPLVDIYVYVYDWLS